MKIISCLFGVMFGLWCHTISAQHSLEFCVEVNEKGLCLQPSKTFQVEANGGTISFLVNHLQPDHAAKLRYKIYYLRENGDEDLLIGIDQKTQIDWQFAWQDVVLFDPGNYKVKVYQVDEKNNESFLCANALTIVGAQK